MNEYVTLKKIITEVLLPDNRKLINTYYQEISYPFRILHHEYVIVSGG